MNLTLIGATFATLGEVLVAYTVIRVHHRVMKEHQIDDKVFKIMRKEQKVAILGIVLIIIGYAADFVKEFI